MKKEKKLDSINKPMIFRIKGIDITKYTISSPAIDNPNTAINVFLEMAIQQMFSVSENLVVNICTINMYDGEKKENHYCSLTTNIGFVVENLSQHIKTSNTPPIGKYLEESCLSILNSITISTVRGILYTKNMGTFLHNSLVPIMDASKQILMSEEELEKKMKIK